MYAFINDPKNRYYSSILYIEEVRTSQRHKGMHPRSRKDLINAKYITLLNNSIKGPHNPRLTFRADNLIILTVVQSLCNERKIPSLVDWQEIRKKSQYNKCIVKEDDDMILRHY